MCIRDRFESAYNRISQSQYANVLVAVLTLSRGNYQGVTNKSYSCSYGVETRHKGQNNTTAICTGLCVHISVSFYLNPTCTVCLFAIPTIHK